MKINFDKRRFVVTSLLGLLFTAMQVIGYQISMRYNTSVHQSEFFQNIGVLPTKHAFLLSLVEFPIWCIILCFLFTMLERVTYIDKKFSPKRVFLLWGSTAVFLFICWIPCFLAGYPGFYNYDAMNQVPQALYAEVPYSAHHPLLHTLLMGKIIAFGYHHGINLNDGIALHSIFQMTVCAIAFAYLIYFILKITGNRILSIIAFCYYAFFPPIAMFAMSTTKDIIFSILLQLSIVFLYEMCKDLSAFWASKRMIARFVITFLLMCLFRKNGIYIVICIIPFVVIFWKKYWKQLLFLFGSIILLYFITDKSLLLALNATEGSTEEAFSVPIQQLARVYFDYGESAFDEEELTLIYEGISETDLLNYNPFLSDNIKNIFDFDVILDNKTAYLSLWLKKGLQYPMEYLKSFLDNTYQAWYPGTSIYDAPDSEQTYYFAMNMCAGGERDTKAPQLLEFYNKIATGYYYQKLPVIRLLFSIGAMFWFALFTLFFAIYQKTSQCSLQC